MEESQMKLYELLELQNLYGSISHIKLPIKTSYKFARLARQGEKELGFYQDSMQVILEEYGEKTNGKFNLTADGQSIAIIPGKEAECNQKLNELRNLEVPIEGIKFTIEELSGIDISIAELSCLMSLIEE